MSSTLRLGIIGCGRILNAHLRGFKKLLDNNLADFRIAALCARKEIDLARFCKRGEGPPPRPNPVPDPGDVMNAPQLYLSDLHPDHEPALYTDYRKMLSQAPIDAVCIFTGHDNHHVIAVDALNAGKHVGVEKPLAITVKACGRMCEAADKAGRVLGVYVNSPYSPQTRAEAWALSHGAIGEIRMLFQSCIGDGFACRPDLVGARTLWRHKKLHAGGGVSMDIGPHIFRRAQTLAGPIRELSAVWKVVEPVRVLLDENNEKVVDSVECDVDDAFFANYILENGAIGHAAFSSAGRGQALAFPGSVNIWGTRGAFSGGNIIDETGQSVSAVEYAGQHAPAEEVESWRPAGVTDTFALEQLDFIQAIQQGRPMRMNGDEGALDVALSYGVLESGLARRAVTPAELLSGEVCEYQRELDEHYQL